MAQKPSEGTGPIQLLAAAKELREASKGPDRCPRHPDAKANPNALPCEVDAVYVTVGDLSPEYKYDCSHEAANHAVLFGDEQDPITVVKGVGPCTPTN